MIWPLVKKEILDLLRDPRILFGMIILPLIMFGVLGTLVNYGAQQAIAVSQPTSMKIFVVDLDKSNTSRDLYSYLAKMTKKTVLLEEPPRNPALYAEERGFTGVVVIPEGFGENITKGVPGKLYVYTYMREASLSEASRVSALNGLIGSYGNVVRQRFAEAANVSTAFVYNPVQVEGKVALSGRIYSAEAASQVTSLLFSIIFAPLIVVGYASQIAATTMGVEKEEHTLEVLLSLPVNRKSIVVAKLSGSIVISILATLGLSLGLIIYIGNVTKMAGGGFAIDLLRNLLNASNMTAIGVALVVGVLLSTSLSMLLGLFGKDVRSSQSLSGVVWTLVFLVGYGLAMIQFTGLGEAAKIAIAAVPLSAPVLALKLSLTGVTGIVWISIAFHIVELVFILYALARIVGSEVMIVGLGLTERFRRLSRRKR